MTNVITWQPGENGKGVVDESGNVHVWNDEEYPLHNDYMSEHPSVGTPRAYFYIEANGEIDVTYPSSHYGEQEAHDSMVNHIIDADPHFHATTDWDLSR